MPSQTPGSKVIDRFEGPHAFLSNFYPCPLVNPFAEAGAPVYPTLEHAFQAAKTNDPIERAQVRSAPTPGAAKRMGRRVTLRADWESSRVGVMRALLWAKFRAEPLLSMLRATGETSLIEGNSWHDQIWGQCYCDTHTDIPGQNLLGQLLMELRGRLPARESPMPSTTSVTVLITGFDPFSGAERNPSGEIAVALDGETVAGAMIRGVVLPTAYDACVVALGMAMTQVRPDFVLLLGMLEGRRGIVPERVALNLDAASIADNDGNLRADQSIWSDGPVAYFSRLPVRAIAAAISAAGLPSGVSLSAGSFVCNHLFYEAMVMTEAAAVRAGLIHVPALPDMVPAELPSMPLEEMIRGIRAALEAILTP